MTFRQSLRMGGWILALVLVLGSVAWAISVRASSGGGQARGHAEEGVRQPGADLLSVSCFGHVDVEQGVLPLMPTQPGRVVKVLVREGDSVPAGAPLLNLDARAARLAVEEATSALQAAQIQLQDAAKAPQRQRIQIAEQRAAIDVARHRLAGAQQAVQKQQKLALASFVNALDVSMAEEHVEELRALERIELAKLTELELHDPDEPRERARADVAVARIRLEKAQLVLDEHVVRAPEAGTVLRILVGPGNLVGGDGKQPALQFVPAGPRLVRAEIDQEFARYVAAGGVARVEDDVRSDLVWRGKVLRLADWYAQRRAGWDDSLMPGDARTLECWIELEVGGPPLRLGQRVRVRIDATTRE